MMVRMLMNERERLNRYFDGELPPAEREAFDQSADHETRQKLAALDDVRRAVKTTVDLQTADIDLVSSVGKALDKQAAQRAWRRRARVASPLLARAAVAAAVAIWLRPVPTLPPAVATKQAATIESLEVEGALATVLDVDDEQGAATVIFIDEDDKEAL